VWRTSGWSAALARTARCVRRLFPHPPAPAATVPACTPGDRTSPRPQANPTILLHLSAILGIPVIDLIDGKTLWQNGTRLKVAGTIF
jgi:hypothetical protein